MITLVDEQAIIGALKDKAKMHLDNLWEDYKIAANTYRRLFDTSVTGVPVTEADFARIRNAKENAHVEAIAIHDIYEQAIAAYRAIGFTGQIGIHTMFSKITKR
jgi:methylphosphotriester-DNA--protein-cysteine methyltransferase